VRAIVNADDLGESREVNDAIFGMMTKGRVTSATFLANGPALQEAATMAGKFPLSSFGVHLNATKWQPLTRDAGLRPILDAEACFAANRLREVAITGTLRAALFREWSAQVERVLSAGVRVSHIDSHHHIHTVPGVFPVLKRLQRHFAIRKVRQTMNIYPDDAPASLRLKASKALWNLALRRYFVTKTTEGFTSLAIFHRTAAKLTVSFEAIELMVHPGQKGFEDETALLGGEWWRDLPMPIRLINYFEL
jgi:chitin disaccharide deacetylase